MNLKQWLIKQFGSKELVERQLTEIDVPITKAPDISPPAQELAEAIEGGKVKLYVSSKDQVRTYYRHIGFDTEFVYDLWTRKLNTIDYAFTEDEAKLLGQALRTCNAKESLVNKAETRAEIAEYLQKQAIDK